MYVFLSLALKLKLQQSLHITFRAWRSADNGIPSAGTVVDFYLKFKIKFFAE